MLSLQIATGVTSSQPIKLVQVPQTTTYIPTTQPTIVSTAFGIETAHYLFWGVGLSPVLSGYEFTGLSIQFVVPNILFCRTAFHLPMPYIFIRELNNVSIQ